MTAPSKMTPEEFQQSNSWLDYVEKGGDASWFTFAQAYADHVLAAERDELRKQIEKAIGDMPAVADYFTDFAPKETP